MRQHDYIKGLFTEAALHEVLRIIERALTFKLYTMADTEGGNYVTTLAIHQALSGLNLEQYIIDCLETILAIRIVTADLGNSSTSKTLSNTGPPYHTVLSAWIFRTF